MEIEDDEIENESRQQCRNKLSRYTKTDDVKREDVVNRLQFMKLKKLKKKTFLSRRKVFFFEDANSITLLLAPIEASERVSEDFLPNLVIKCQCNRRMMSR